MGVAVVPGENNNSDFCIDIHGCAAFVILLSEIEMFVYRLNKTFYMLYEQIRWMNGWIDVDR